MEDNYSDEIWDYIIDVCETLRQRYIETKDKRYWKELIRILPEGYLQTRTVTMNYENLYSIEGSRYNEVVANVELMNESMVYGQGIMRTNNEPTFSINQFSLFRVRPEYIDTSTFWLRDQSDDKYCLVNYGMADVFSAGVYTTNGIRPCFPLCGIEIT